MSKRNTAAKLSGALGLTALLRLAPRQPSLVVLNHHRIGDPSNTDFDHDVFTATGEELREQARFLKSNFDAVTLDDAIAIVEGKITLRNTAVLLTFDDGYIDNFEIAFPVLASERVQGVFFLPTSFIGTNRIPWWDTIAYIIRRSSKPEFQIDGRHFDKRAQGVANVVRGVQEMCKVALRAGTNAERFIQQVEHACDSPRPGESARCFMNWNEAAEMARGGMAIGSHTHSHELLASLSEDDQLRELSTSRQILQERLGTSIDSLAYPNGQPADFNELTKKSARSLGYRIAFSFYGGPNTQPVGDPYDVRRFGITLNTPSNRFELQMRLAGVGPGYWF